MEQEKKLYNFYNISLQPILWCIIVSDLYLTLMIAIIMLMNMNPVKYGYLASTLFNVVSTINIFVIITVIALVIDLIIAIKDGIKNKKEIDEANKKI